MHAITIGGVQLERPLINAAGTCKTLPEVRRFAASDVAAVLVGSHLVDRRSVGTAPAFFSGDEGRLNLNAQELPSGGLSYLKRYLRTMVECCAAVGKPLILNIAGFDPKEFQILAKLAVACGVSVLEVNLSCPTIGGKVPICYRRQETALVANAVADGVRNKIPLVYKLGYFTDKELLADQVSLLLDKKAHGFTVINTLGNGAIVDPDGRSVLGDQVFDGVSGPTLLPLGIGMVRQLRKMLPKDIDISGVGGINSWANVMQYLWAGANTVQTGTACWNRGKTPAVYSEILAESYSSAAIPAPL